MHLTTPQLWIPAPAPQLNNKQHHRHYQDIIYSLLLCKDNIAFYVHLSSYIHHFLVYNVLYSCVYCFFL